ncbi:MAG: DegT/DnrJ/EryC1/StrS family aminotransferase [Bacteroidia bacterium]
MKIPFVDLHAQYNSIQKEIDSALASVIRDTAFIGGGGNKYVRSFEEAFGAFSGFRHCIGCANGTDSLEILLKAFGIGPGDEVIVPALTWISTSEAVGNVGAIPVFVDVHPIYYTIDVSLIEAKITSRTKAIIPVHLYGLPAEMDEIMIIAKKHKLYIIEDCAQSHAAVYKGKKIGTIGHAASFSFYPGKNLGAYGDAGAMAMNDEELAHTCRMIANHGQQEKHNHLMEGRNSRLDGLHAAVLSAKLPYLEKWTQARIEHASEYKNQLKGSAILCPSSPDYSKHVYHLYVVQVKNREGVQAKLKEAGVETAVHYPTPLPLLKAYAARGFKGSDFPVAVKACSEILSLPMFAELKESEIKSICVALKGSV